MLSLNELARRLAALEAKRKLRPEGQELEVWFAGQCSGLGLSPRDPLASALASHAGQAAVRAFRDPDSPADPSWWPSVCAAIGVGLDGTIDDILAAARSGLRRDADAYRSRVLAAHAAATAEERELTAGRYDPVTKQWVFKSAWWVSAEMWNRSLPADEASRRCMAKSQATL